MSAFSCLQDVDLPPSIADSVEDFMITKQLEEGRSENTIKAYAHDLSLFFKHILATFNQLGQSFKQLEDIRVAHVKRFLQSLADRTYTQVGLARKIATLKSFFSHAKFMDLIPSNPMDRVKSPRISREHQLPKHLTRDEVNRVLEYLKQNRLVDEYILFRFMYATMCRVSELCTIKIKDVNFELGTVRLHGKGNKERLVPIDEATRRLIQQVLLPKRAPVSDDDALFINTRGKPVTPRVVQQMFQHLKQDLGFPNDKKFTPHVMRHTGATMLRRNGMDISELQDLLGHASPNTTRIYAKNDITTLNASYKKMHPLNQP